jgi:hypothetical protein
MIKTGLWIELETAIAFLVGLGLGSLLGQRTVGVILMIVLEIVLTPIVLRVKVAHLENLQRAVVGVATAHLEPGQLPLAFGGGGHDYRLTESTTTAVCVILAWIIGLDRARRLAHGDSRRLSGPDEVRLGDPVRMPGWPSQLDWQPRQLACEVSALRVGGLTYRLSRCG